MTDRSPRPPQDILNAMMRRRDVKELVLALSIQTDAPATPAQVRRFLQTAPPEVFVLLDELVPKPTAGVRSESVYDNCIVQGFVGAVIERGLLGRGPGGPR